MIVTETPSDVEFLVGYFEDVVADDPMVFTADDGRLRADCGCAADERGFVACTDHHERLTTALTPEGAVH